MLLLVFVFVWRGFEPASIIEYILENPWQYYDPYTNSIYSTNFFSSSSFDRLWTSDGIKRIHLKQFAHDPIRKC